MRTEALPFLVCPTCDAALALAPADVTSRARENDGHIMDGQLVCAGRACRFPIQDGVPILLPGEVDSVEIETAARFADEWTHWRGLRGYYERQFLGWLAPLSPHDFAGKTVFEGGCGKGRHTAVVAGFGAKAIVSIDLGKSAFVAFENTRHLPNAHVVIGDLLCPPVAPVFDVAFSVGVVHHLPDPARGFDALAARVRDGGRVAVWVYGRENNEWITRYVDPVRSGVTAKLPPGLLRAASTVPAALVWSAIKLLAQMDPGGRVSRFPYGEYFASMHDFPFDEIHSIVFDQLVTPVAHYLPGDEVRRWFQRGGFRDTTVRWHNHYSWTGVGTIARTGPV